MLGEEWGVSLPICSLIPEEGFPPNYCKPTWKSEVKDCDLLTETAFKISSYSCNAADAWATAQLRLALKTADTKPEIL